MRPVALLTDLGIEGASGLLELAVSQGSAARVLGLGRGDRVEALVGPRSAARGG